MRRFVQALSTRSVSPWEYGAVNGRPARRHILTGECQFVLWKAGKQGHTEDYWHRFGAGHEKHFRLNAIGEARADNATPQSDKGN
jgi:hypothetical protein